MNNPLKTEKELQALKDAWVRDPSWDIETTEGFELYTKSLLEFRMECEARWKAAETDADRRRVEKTHFLQGKIDALALGESTRFNDVSLITRAPGGYVIEYLEGVGIGEAYRDRVTSAVFVPEEVRRG